LNGWQASEFWPFIPAATVDTLPGSNFLRPIAKNLSDSVFRCVSPIATYDHINRKTPNGSATKLDGGQKSTINQPMSARIPVPYETQG
jgi:hypothetical protein